MSDAMEVVNTTSIVESPSIKQKTAGFWMRFWAFILDSLVISAIVGISVRPLFALMNWNTAGDAWYAPFTIVSGLIFYAYFVLLTKFFKQTLGKMAFGIKVQKDNGEALDWMTVLFREGVGRFINGTLLYLPYLIVAFAPDNKSIADYFADTVVIHENIYTQ
ncbi:RDD family protein [Solibacillus silvestris]|uniref:RDD family protein n=1 Tax=Solibacillus silvestris TaxID=76853 RepID=UPI003F7F1D95